MKSARASQAFIKFSGLAETLHRGLTHTIVDDEFQYDQQKGYFEIHVNLASEVPLKHYQGESTLDVQVDLDDGRTTIVANGGMVLGPNGSDSQTVRIRLKGNVAVRQKTDR